MLSFIPSSQSFYMNYLNTFTMQFISGGHGGMTNIMILKASFPRYQKFCLVSRFGELTQHHIFRMLVENSALQIEQIYHPVNVHG